MTRKISDFFDIHTFNSLTISQSSIKLFLRIFQNKNNVKSENDLYRESYYTKAVKSDSVQDLMKNATRKDKFQQVHDGQFSREIYLPPLNSAELRSIHVVSQIVEDINSLNISSNG